MLLAISTEGSFYCIEVRKNVLCELRKTVATRFAILFLLWFGSVKHNRIPFWLAARYIEPLPVDEAGTHAQAEAQLVSSVSTSRLENSCKSLS
jgi:hypothetical protein